MKHKKIKQGDIWICNLNPVVGSEQGGIRPVLVVQNDVGNLHSNTTIIVPLTKQDKVSLPQHILLNSIKYNFLTYDSTVLCEQVRCLDVTRLEKKIGVLLDPERELILDLINKNFNL